MRLVCISGKRRSGKTTLGNILKEEYGYYPISLAEPLKNDVSRKYGLTLEQTDGHFKESPTQYAKPSGGFYTPRDIMILEGQHTRSIYPDYYCKQLFHQMQLAEQAQMQTFVVTDVRFMNELEWMKKHNALLVRLERDEHYTGAAINDPSETSLDVYDAWDLRFQPHENVDMSDLARIAEMINARICARV